MNKVNLAFLTLTGLPKASQPYFIACTQNQKLFHTQRGSNQWL